MSISTQVPVQIFSRNNHELPPTSGHIERIHWEKADRPKNAMKILGMGLAACFASVFIPIAHFVLVPSLFIASFVFALDKLKESDRGAGGEGECPHCHQSFHIEKSKWQLRLTDTCGNCHDDLEIRLPENLDVPTPPAADQHNA